MSFLGNLFGYDSRGNDLIGVNQDSRYNCVACGLACSVHTPAMEGNCLRVIFGNRGAEPVTTAVTAAENTETQVALQAGSAETGGEKADVSFDQQLLEELENQIAHRNGFGLDCEQLQQVRSCVFDALCVVNRGALAESSLSSPEGRVCPNCGSTRGSVRIEQCTHAYHACCDSGLFGTGHYCQKRPAPPVSSPCVHCGQQVSPEMDFSSVRLHESGECV